MVNSIVIVGRLLAAPDPQPDDTLHVVIAVERPYLTAEGNQPPPDHFYVILNAKTSGLVAGLLSKGTLVGIQGSASGAVDVGHALAVRVMAKSLRLLGARDTQPQEAM